MNKRHTWSQKNLLSHSAYVFVIMMILRLFVETTYPVELFCRRYVETYFANLDLKEPTMSMVPPLPCIPVSLRRFFK